MNATPTSDRARSARLRSALLAAKLIGLTAFLGSLMALTALGILGPRPTSIEGWTVLRDAMRAIFWPCLFGGLVLTVLAGLGLWLRARKVFLRQRWFQLKLVAFVLVVPILHIRARGRVQEFYAAIDEGRLDALDALWTSVTWGYAIALIVMLGLAAVGRAKPRLGG